MPKKEIYRMHKKERKNRKKKSFVVVHAGTHEIGGVGGVTK